METEQPSEHNANSDHATLNLTAATKSTESTSTLSLLKDLEEDVHRYESSKVSLRSKIPELQTRLARLSAEVQDKSPETTNEATDGPQLESHPTSLHDHHRQQQQLVMQVEENTREVATLAKRLAGIEKFLAEKSQADLARLAAQLTASLQESQTA